MKLLSWLFAIGLLGFAGYLFFPVAFPCAQPVRFSIGDIDPRFGISREEFTRIATAASELWETESGKDLFELVPSGGVVVSALYDERQEAKGRLNDIHKEITEDKKSLDEFNAEIDAMKKVYDEDKREYDRLVASYERSVAAYEAKVDAINERGGGTREEIEASEKERQKLNDQVIDLQERASILKKENEQINAFIATSNQVVEDHNEKVGEYKDVGSVLGEEFHEGMYTSSGLSKKIEVFVFDDAQSLKGLLAHELGHALGLDHTQDKDSVMYYLHLSPTPTLTQADLTALEDRCEVWKK